LEWGERRSFLDFGTGLKGTVGPIKSLEVSNTLTAVYGMQTDAMQFDALEAERIKRHQERDVATA